jgi:hypothetical protein
MDEIDALAQRFPDHVWTIRQLHRRDGEFRSLCEDYGEALRALEHWKRFGVPSDKRVEEYRELAKDLEDEVLRRVTARGQC